MDANITKLVSLFSSKLDAGIAVLAVSSTNYGLINTVSNI